MTDQDPFDLLSDSVEDAQASQPPDLLIAEHSPRRQTLSGYTSSQQVHLSLTNQSDRPLPLHVTATDAQNRCRFEFRRAGAAEASPYTLRLTLQPAERADIGVRVTPPAPALASFRKRVYSFTIVATTRQAPQTPYLIPGYLHYLPLLGPNALVALFVSLIIVTVSLISLLSPVAPDVPAPAKIEFVEIAPKVAAPVVINPTATSAPVIAPPVQEPFTYEAMFRDIASQHGLDWRILAIQAYYESSLNPLAVGVNNDLGLMQIIPSTWNEWAPRVGVTDPFDPYSNVRVAAAYLAFLREYFSARGYPDDYWMLVAYNWGPYNLELFLEDESDWQQVPNISRQYALNILAATSGASADWTMVRSQVASRQLTQ